MYKVSVPVILTLSRFEEYYKTYIKQCKEAGVSRVFLCSTNWTSPESEKQHCIELLKKYIPIFKAEGFEVGAWINSLGHGGTCGDFVDTNTDDGLTRMRGLDGQVNMGAYCPLCENLQELAADWIRRLGQTDLDLIMMDDDYRYAYRNDILCACDLHVKLFEEELGEPWDAKRMKEALTSGGPNRWRDVWLKVQGKSLCDFARILRDALDSVNPNMRMSICSVLSTWDIDGVDSITLARILAGNTKPFLRLIGAPYWAALRNFQEARLATVCEYERLQQEWCKDSGIEIFCEGDTYPRPTYLVPAAYLEAFDQIMRAGGKSHGILKYMFDYSASPGYETRYVDRHIEDKPLFEVLERVMGEKENDGVTIFAPMKTFALSHRPGDNPDHRCIPAALRFATDTSLPVRYDAGQDAAIIFGDAAELAGDEQLKNGAVLDITAAQVLTRRGYDVGLKQIIGATAPGAEEFIAEDDTVAVVGGDWYHAEIAASAKVDSWQILSEPGREAVRYPAVYTYENAKGQRFAVYCFHAQESFEMGHARGLFRTWTRTAQIRRILPWLSGHKLDAICDGAPELYMMTKRDESHVSVALWNMGVDPIRSHKVRLGAEGRALTCEWGKATLAGDVVTVDNLAAFECVCFTVEM